MSKSHPLDDARLKLVRAEEHLKTIRKMLANTSIGKCEIVPEDDNDVGVLRVHLPNPDPMLSVVAGDFCHNVRSVLDYIVWQLVLSNPPNTPKKRNMFPICSSRENFDLAVTGHRLDGIAEAATTIIEGLQPYPGRDQTLLTLSTIYDIDKHQTLNLITAVAYDTYVEWRGNTDSPFFSMLLGNEELRNGAIFGNVGVPFTEQFARYLGGGETLADFRKRFLKMKVEGEAAIFVAFDEPSAEELEPMRIDTVLEEILEFVREDVVPAFEPFFN